jgi:hypothetical protein
MEFKKLIALLLVFCLAYSTLSTAYATISKEYDYTARDFYGNDAFGFKVTITVETEQNDVWFTNSHYFVTFTITLNYVNTSLYSYTSVGTWMVFDKPSLEGLNATVPWVATYNKTTVYLGDSQALEMQCNPTSKGTASFTPGMDWTFVSNHNTTTISGLWSSEEPMYIDVQASGTQPTSPPASSDLAYFAIGLIVGIFIAGVVSATLFVWTKKKRVRDN